VIIPIRHLGAFEIINSYLEVIMQRYDILMTAGYPLEHRNLIAHLRIDETKQVSSGLGRPSDLRTDHMFSALHELLVDDLASIILASLDVDRFFDYGIRPATESLARSVLHLRKQ
jgi:hypothetical protein